MYDETMKMSMYILSEDHIHNSNKGPNTSTGEMLSLLEEYRHDSNKDTSNRDVLSNRATIRFTRKTLPVLRPVQSQKVPRPEKKSVSEQYKNYWKNLLCSNKTSRIGDIVTGQSESGTTNYLNTAQSACEQKINGKCSKFKLLRTRQTEHSGVNCSEKVTEAKDPPEKPVSRTSIRKKIKLVKSVKRKVTSSEEVCVKDALKCPRLNEEMTKGRTLSFIDALGEYD